MKAISMRFIKNILFRSFFYEIVQIVRFKLLSGWLTEHEKKMLDFYSQFIKSGDLCFDVGANVGNRTKIFLKLGASVVAVEPQERCIFILRSVYGSDPHVKFVPKALGDKEGDAEMLVSNVGNLSTLSKEWVKSVQQSGRFSSDNWYKSQKTPTTTLDCLMERYGVPSFIKIDVEGFENHVIRGLSQPIRALSFEFTPEYLEATIECIHRLSKMGSAVFNYSLGESMKLVLQEWVSPEKMIELLSEPKKGGDFGDIYVRFLSLSQR